MPPGGGGWGRPFVGEKERGPWLPNKSDPDGFHLPKSRCCRFALLVLKGINFTTAHVFSFKYCFFPVGEQANGGLSHKQTLDESRGSRGQPQPEISAAALLIVCTTFGRPF